MVGGVHEPVEVVEHLVDREELLDGVEAEGGHALQRDRREHAESTDTDPRHFEDIGVLVRGTVDDGTVGRDEAQPDDPA